MQEKTTFESSPSDLLSIALAIVLSLLILAPASFAADYSNALALPPGGNPPPLIDTSATTQTKGGSFWADAIGATDSFCIGASCVTSWPWTPSPATCQLDTMIKQGSVNQSGRDPGDRSPVGSGCVLSAAEVAAGWIPMSWDHCSWVSSADCAGWTYCKFSRLSCTGSVLVTPGTVYRGTPYYTQSYYQSGYEGGYESGYTYTQGYYQSSYYGQSSYYAQSSYYGQSSYYAQSYYQSSYYAQGYYQGTYGGGGCFSAETLVAMADGSLKKISDVRIGDTVLSADQVTGEQTVSTVTNTLEHVGSYETLLLNDITVTPNHKIKVLRGGNEEWLPASEIRVGDSLISTDGSSVPVTSITPNGVVPVVYNLTTVPSHTYYAGGVLVHNIKQ